MKVVYIVPVLNPAREIYKSMGYRFIPREPQEVPEEVGKLLLEMRTSPCRCHGKKPEKMFIEV